MARAPTEVTELSSADTRYQQDLLAFIFKWLSWLGGAVAALYLAHALLRRTASELLFTAEGLVSTALALWCYRRVRRGDLRRPARIFFVFLLFVEAAFMISTPQPLRLLGVLAFVLVAILTTVLESPRLAPWWVGASAVAYTAGAWGRRVLGQPNVPITSTDEVEAWGTALSALVLVAFLNRGIVRHLRAALSTSETTRHDLESTTEKLQQEQAALQSFAYVVSHDLRAPLRALSNYSRFLQEDCAAHLDENCREYIQGIGDSARRMDSLVVDLLEYSRIGRVETELSEVDLGALVERVVSTLHLREKAEVSLPARLPTVRAREVRLQQIFTNLLDNAVKFQRPGARPAVTVECADRGDAWELSVRDNGIGIEPHHFDKIFGVFQRLHAQDEYEGTGIGLAIVKKAVEEHRGRVWVDSTPGQGSVFRFTLPKA